VKNIIAAIALVPVLTSGITVPAAHAQIVARQAQSSVNGTITLPANTAIIVSMNDDLTSKTAQVGTPFTATVVTDVIQGGYVVIPKGSRANGQVLLRTGKGAFGKSGKMEVEIGSIEVNGGRINTTGKFRQEGEGNTVATIGAVVVAGVFAAFVTGKSALIPRGRELTIYTKEPVTISLAD
jgi:hypothetical protein